MADEMYTNAAETPVQPTAQPAAQPAQTAQAATTGTGAQKICKKCKTSIPASASKCPNCGSKVSPFYKRWWFWALIILLLAGLAGGGTAAKSGNSNKNFSAESTQSQSQSGSSASSSESSSSDNSAATSEESSESTEQAAQEEEESAPYTIEKEKLSKDDFGFVSISGQLTNQSGSDVSYLQIEYNLYDKDGAQIGTAIDNTTNLGDGKTWKFKASSLDNVADEVDSFEVADVTGW